MHEVPKTNRLIERYVTPAPIMDDEGHVVEEFHQQLGERYLWDHAQGGYIDMTLRSRFQMHKFLIDIVISNLLKVHRGAARLRKHVETTTYAVNVERLKIIATEPFTTRCCGNAGALQ